jgi:uncharacterized lipoprotein NlpE involved in copper resistance
LGLNQKYFVAKVFKEKAMLKKTFFCLMLVLALSVVGCDLNKDDEVNETAQVLLVVNNYTTPITEVRLDGLGMKWDNLSLTSSQRFSFNPSITYASITIVIYATGLPTGHDSIAQAATFQAGRTITVTLNNDGTLSVQ